MSRIGKSLSKALTGRDSRRASAANSSAEESEPSDIEDLSTGAAHEKYRLRVSAGPSYDPSTQRIVLVNSQEVTSFENEFMRVRVKVRVKEYTGLPKGSPANSAYFSDPSRTKDQYSVSFSFIPKVDIPSADTVWGNDFDNPIKDRLPPGFNTAFRIVKQFVDPGLEIDPYAEKPWLLGPSLSCWFQFRIGDQGKMREPQLDEVVHEGGDGSGKEVRSLKQIPEDSEKRRKYFLDATHRKEFEFEKGRQYQGDFHNPYIDFNKMALKLPGVTIQVAKHIGVKTHKLRYVFKNKITGDVYFVVVFSLLFGPELQEALHEDKTKESQREEYHESFGGVD